VNYGYTSALVLGYGSIPAAKHVRFEDVHFVATSNKFAIWIQFTPAYFTGRGYPTRASSKQALDDFRFLNCTWEHDGGQIYIDGGDSELTNFVFDGEHARAGNRGARHRAGRQIRRWQVGGGAPTRRRRYRPGRDSDAPPEYHSSMWWSTGMNRIPALTAILLALASVAFSQSKLSTNIPHLEKQGTATQLIVDGKPFLVLGAELNNSSASSMEYMRPLWPKIAATNLNTVLATVSWELMEPEEGQFDFSLVDGLIQDARRYNLRLILLWFGSWKNGKSTYQPVWVKTNQQRFPLIQDETGKGLPTLSTLSDANRDADSQAFAALMKHIREVDGEAHTVIMIQVENEVGVLGPSRDHSRIADSAFAASVPKEFMEYLQKHKDTLIPELHKRWEASGFKTAGSWEEVFGAGMETDELFMAWNYARYVGHVAAAGKAEYPLPMFVNTWLRQGSFKPNEDKPGGFPSGGPLPEVMDAWRAGGPAIDILAPDVHVPELRRLVQVVQTIRQSAIHPRVQGRRSRRGSGDRDRRQV
jgi:hypothetical protein